MTKVHLLGANRSYDRDIQTVSVNQIVVLEGYAGGSYVVYDVTHNQRGFTYHLVHTRTYDFNTSCNASHVFSPTHPSAVRCCDRWNRQTVSWVFCPNIPSMLIGYPHSFNNSWRTVTPALVEFNPIVCIRFLNLLVVSFLLSV